MKTFWRKQPGGMLAPDGNLEVVIQAGGGGIASAQVEASSWYPNGDTGQTLSDSLADVVIDVALTESSPGNYTGSLPLAAASIPQRVYGSRTRCASNSASLI